MGEIFMVALAFCFQQVVPPPPKLDNWPKPKLRDQKWEEGKDYASTEEGRELI